MILSAGAAAAAAAEAERQRQLEEEETMPQDYGEDWEFKILRSATAAFRNPSHLQKALEEEAQAGWTLLEKFDDQRLRLKRPTSARKNDAQLSTDPYRTYYGVGQTALTIWILLGVFGTIIAVFGVIIGGAVFLKH